MKVLTSLSIVIPAYNEEASIGATIADAFDVGAQVTAGALEVLVCNDGSRDRTAEIVRGTKARLIDREINAGIEASMRALYAEAKHDWVFLMSADRQWPMTELHGMSLWTANANFIIGVRANKRDVYTPYRRVVSWGYERIVRMLGAPGGDPGSIKLARRAFLDIPVVARGVFAEGERIIRAARAGAQIAEYPVEFHKRGAGKATGARSDVVITALTDAVRVASSLAVGWPKPTR